MAATGEHSCAWCPAPATHQATSPRGTITLCEECAAMLSALAFCKAQHHTPTPRVYVEGEPL